MTNVTDDIWPLWKDATDEDPAGTKVKPATKRMSADPDADAKLLRLVREFDNAVEAEHATTNDEEGLHQCTIVTDKIIHRIARVPARTSDELMMKIRVLRYCEVPGSDTREAMLDSFIRDVTEICSTHAAATR
jgi:hypothetical protein